MNLSLVCRLLIVCKIHAFFVERELLFIASLHPSISCNCSFLCRHPCCSIGIAKLPLSCSFVCWAWTCQPRPQLLTLRAWACLCTRACMNSEKYMNSKKSYLFTTFFLLVLQDASLSLSLQCFVPKTSLINYISILGHQVLLLYASLLACSSRFNFRALSSSLSLPND